MLTEAIQNIILNNLMQKGTVNLNINCLVQNGIIKAGKSHYKWKEIKLVFFFPHWTNVKLIFILIVFIDDLVDPHV